MANRETPSIKRKKLEELVVTSITFDEGQPEKVQSGEAQAVMPLSSAADGCFEGMVRVVIESAHRRTDV